MNLPPPSWCGLLLGAARARMEWSAFTLLLTLVRSDWHCSVTNSRHFNTGVVPCKTHGLQRMIMAVAVQRIAEILRGQSPSPPELLDLLAQQNPVRAHAVLAPALPA